MAYVFRPRPSCMITMDIDSRLDTQEMREEIWRCWAFVGGPRVVSHEPESEDAPFSNTLEIKVKLGTHSYLLDSSSEESRANWHELVAPHVRNRLNKVGNHVKIFNRYLRQKGSPQLQFEYFDFNFEYGQLTMRFHVDSNGDVTGEHHVDATAVREALDGGLLGTLEKGSVVTLPAPAFYVVQEEIGMEAKRQRDIIKKAAEMKADFERAEREAGAEAAAEEKNLESPELVAEAARAAAAAKMFEQAAAADAAALAATGATAEDFEQPEEEERKDGEIRDYRDISPDKPMTEEEFAEKYLFPEVYFDLDYHIWEVEPAGGESFLFDSETNERVLAEDLDVSMVRTVELPTPEELAEAEATIAEIEALIAEAEAAAAAAAEAEAAALAEAEGEAAEEPEAEEAAEVEAEPTEEEADFEALFADEEPADEEPSPAEEPAEAETPEVEAPEAE